MIDVELIMESVEWNSSRGFGWQECGVTYDEMYQLITRLRQAEKDAARYRFVKSNSLCIECDGFNLDTMDGQDLDAMIDDCIEAMNASNN